MRRLRQIAYAILFAGWMVPALLAQVARDRAPTKAPGARMPMDLMIGDEPLPSPVEQVVTMFRVIAGLWFLIALIYAAVLTIRLRRTLV